MKKTIRPIELKKLLDDDKAILIDIREDYEYERCHIEQALLKKVPEIRQMDCSKKLIVIHCEMGFRSDMAAAELADKNVYVLEKGIEGWRKAGLPVVGTQKVTVTIISVMRQVQLILGTIALAGVVLGAFLNPWFYSLSAFVGAALVISGSTGWCGLNMMVAKLPWNK